MAVGNRNTPTKEILIIRKPEPRIEKRKRAWDLAVVAYSPIENWCPQRPPPLRYSSAGVGSLYGIQKSTVRPSGLPDETRFLVKPELRRDTNTKTKDKNLCVRGRLTVRLSESTARPSELPG